MTGVTVSESGDYPISTKAASISGIAAPASGDTATVTFAHLNGTAGTIQASVNTDGTIVEIVATSLAG